MAKSIVQLVLTIRNPLLLSRIMITPFDEIAALKEISKTFAGLEQQLRGLATNVNQMAHVANGRGELPTENDLDLLSDQLAGYRRESESLWQSIRLLINQQKPTGQ